MSDGREPSAGVGYDEYLASGRRSERDQEVTEGREPSLDTGYGPASGRTIEQKGLLSEVINPHAAPDAEDLSWQQHALCAQTDPEAFFPEKGGSTREAKKVCRSCEVRTDCLEYALAHDERFGIWGGMSERERRRFKREVG